MLIIRLGTALISLVAVITPIIKLPILMSTRDKFPVWCLWALCLLWGSWPLLPFPELYKLMWLLRSNASFARPEVFEVELVLIMRSTTSCFSPESNRSYSWVIWLPAFDTYNLLYQPWGLELSATLQMINKLVSCKIPGTSLRFTDTCSCPCSNAYSPLFMVLGLLAPYPVLTLTKLLLL